MTSIEEWAFSSCGGLTEIIIPNSVTSIGEGAFNGCSSLICVTAEMTTPFTLESDAFSYISSTCSLYVPKGTKDAYIAKGWTTEIFQGGVYETSTFTYTYNGQTLTYKITDDTNNYVQVGNGEKAAISTSVGGTVSIPNKVTYQGKTYSVKGIGDNAFDGCSSLTSVTIPSSVTSIEDWAFFGCSGLTSITIPNGVTYIGEGAFQECGLTSVTIPSSVTSIGDEAFINCSSLASVTISSSVIGYCMFAYCSSLNSVTFSNGVTTIGDGAFLECSSLSSITIPKSVISIGGGAFDSCSGLTAISVESGNTVYDSRSNCNAIIETVSNTLIAGCQNTVIPSDVTAIGDYAFNCCTGLTSITIPGSVTSIGEGAFSGCSSLICVTAEMTSPFVLDSEAFFNIGSTCSLYVPKGTKDAYIAKGWTTEIFEGGVYEISTDDTFTYTYSGQTLTYKITDNTNYYVQVGDGEKAAISTSVSGAVSIPNKVTYQGKTYSVTRIGWSAFQGCRGLTSVTIPNSVTSIGDWAFYHCSGLTSVTIPNSVTSIGDGAFDDCSGLTSITIPNSVTSIGDYVFCGCSGLTSISIPNSVISIGKFALAHCSGLTAITIPSSVTSLGQWVFYNSSGLAAITIPHSVTNIGEWAFALCSSLTTVTAEMSTPFTFGSGAFSYIGSTCRLYVPKGTKDAYIAQVWGIKRSGRVGESHKQAESRLFTTS